MEWKDTLVVAYRWFGKSSFVTLKYILRRSTQHWKTACIFSATEDLAIKKLRDIKATLETDPNMNRYCAKGIFTWTDKEIWLTDKTKVIIQEDWTKIYPVISKISAAGFDSKSRWLHYDIIVADDIVVEENTFTPDLTAPDPDKIAKVKMMFWRKVIPIKNPWWCIILVWTPQYWDENNPNDSDLLYAWKNSTKNQFFLPALDELGKPSCPELHSLEFLEEQKQSIMDTAKSLDEWMREYMLSPQSKWRKGIEEESILQCYNYNDTYYIDYVPMKNEVCIVWTDYAIQDSTVVAEKNKTAYFSIVVVVYNTETRKRSVKYISYERWLPAQDVGKISYIKYQIDKTLKAVKNYWAHLVAIEWHWWMDFFRQELELLLPHTCNIANATNKGNKFDPILWLPSLYYLFTDNLIELPARDDEDKKKNDFMKHELLYLSNAWHVDVIDALLRADTVIRDMYGSISFNPNFSVRKINRDKDRYRLSPQELEELTIYGPPSADKIKEAEDNKRKEAMYFQRLNEQVNVKISRKR
jgi:hypothetical protein